MDSADVLRAVRDHGMAVRLHETLGFNYRMTDIFAAIASASPSPRRRHRAAPPNAARRRQRLRHRWAARLRRLAGAPRTRITCTRAWTSSGSPATATRRRALNAEGVGTAIHYPRPLNQQPVFMNDPEVDCSPLPVSDRLAKSVFCIPVHPHVTDPQLRQVGEAVAKVASAMRA
ncbi:MAG: DegT/DnrJ/EryC1/StrS family aminotransferase [Phycisphaerales bacterium]